MLLAAVVIAVASYVVERSKSDQVKGSRNISNLFKKISRHGLTTATGNAFNMCRIGLINPFTAGNKVECAQNYKPSIDITMYVVPKKIQDY